MLRSFKSRFSKGGNGSNTGSRHSLSDDENSNSNTTTPTSTTTATLTTSSTPTRPRMWKNRKTSDEKLSSLSCFDACVHAADALGAASGSQPEGTILSARKDRETGLVDCSVLVSADGDLLLVSNQRSTRSLLLKKKKQQQQNRKSRCDDSVDSVDTMGSNEHSQVNDMFSQLIAQGKDDYESAIFLGNDLEKDRELNGFSAKGWSFAATSHALYQTEQSMKNWLVYCQSLVQQKQASAAEALHTCQRWQQGRQAASTVSPSSAPWRGGSNIAIKGSDWELIDPRASDFEESAQRVGPLQAPESSTLYAAVLALENYQTAMAQADLERFAKNTDASTSSSQQQQQQQPFVPVFEKSTQQLSKRVENRQQALAETSRRVRKMEDRLVQLKQASDKSWESVYYAETKVTKRVEQIMKDRRKDREKQRLAQLRKQQEEQQQQQDDSQQQQQHRAEEIWDMVSAVSVDDATFEPMMELPGAGGDVDDASVASSIKSSHEPAVSRESIEHEVGLPELRSAAMRADADIDEAAQELLTLLSSLDTTRRSARTAAETCLVAAGNAQAASLQSWIQLERESLEERLAGLDALESAVGNIDVRADLDQYIRMDKKGRGGSSHLGDDDDGGIASALATLSSHVDGILGGSATASVTRRRKNTGSSVDDLIHELEDDGTTIETIEKSLEKLFAKTPQLQDDAPENEENKQVRKDFDESVDFLCRTALGNRRAGRRSVLCYKLNARRSTQPEIRTKIQLAGLCKVFSAILTGCQTEEGGVTNAKMCIMLAQTFYWIDRDIAKDEEISTGSKARNRRVYIRSELKDHPIWSEDEFWDEALSQQISEALTQSGVMSNFEKQKVAIARKIRKNSEWAQMRKTKWHDLNSTERVEAASQVHAVVFAQLGALAHSMIEFGCGLERSCAFVRRMAIRNQLPSSHRTMLLQHLVTRDDTEIQAVHSELTEG